MSNSFFQGRRLLFLYAFSVAYDIITGSSTVTSAIVLKHQNSNWGRSKQALADSVKNEMSRMWSAYKKHAWGANGINTITGEPTSSPNGPGVESMVVDSLDTLWLMGFRREFEEAVSWLDANFLKKLPT